jgi:hypothetical protein
MKIINLTPHPIHILSDEGIVVRTIDSTGLARLSASTVSVGDVDGIPLTRTVFGEPTGLPDAVEGTLLIVSQIIKSALPARADLVVPAGVQRDKEGIIIGCRSLDI